MSPPGASELEKVARGGAANLVGAAINGVAGFLLVLVVTRLLEKSDAGTFFALTSIFLILLAAVELGATTGLVKWIPQYVASGRELDLRSLLRAALLPVLLVSTLAAALLWPLAPWLTGALTHGGPAGAGVLRAMAIFLPVAACYDLLLAATRGFDRIRPTVLVERMGRVPGQLLLVLVAAAASGGLWQVCAAWALPYLPGLLMAVWLAVRLLLGNEQRAWRRRTEDEADLAAGRPTKPQRRPPAPRTGRRKALPSVAVEFWAYTWARGLSRIFQVALLRLDIVLISALLTPRDAAIYTAATRLVPVGLLGVQAVQQVLQPQLAKLLALEDIPAAQRIYRASTAWSMALSWPIYCAAAVFAPQVLRLFGAGYDEGATAMMWVSGAMLIATACGAADLALLMSGRSGLSLWNTAIALGADVVLNLILLPRIGITGAGVAWAVAILLTNLPPLVQVRHYVGLVPFSRGAALVAASAVTLFGAGSYAANQLAGPGSLRAMALWPAPAALVYLAILRRAHHLLEIGPLIRAIRNRGSGGPAGPGPGQVQPHPRISGPPRWPAPSTVNGRQPISGRPAPALPGQGRDENSGDLTAVLAHAFPQLAAEQSDASRSARPSAPRPAQAPGQGQQGQPAPAEPVGRQPPVAAAQPAGRRHTARSAGRHVAGQRRGGARLRHAPREPDRTAGPA